MLRKRPAALQIETPRSEDEQPGFARPDATASISLQSFSGDLKLISSSFQEYKFTEHGLHKTTKERPLSGGKFYQISDKDIQIIHALGEGASSTVYKGFFETEGQFVAVKKINCLERERRRQVMNDIRGLCDVSHSSLVQFIGAYRMPDSAQISIVLEYMDSGSLADLVKQVGRVPEAVLSNITAQVLQGLLYLHKTRHTVHRDIKPANILLNSSGRVKIADFGISAFIDNTLALCNTFLGTVTYMSPERINSRPYSFAADIWSLGLSLLECAAGKYPYDASAGPLVLMMQVLNEEVPLLEEGSDELLDFLKQCLQKDPLKRPSAEVLLAHPFVLQHSSHSTDLRNYLLGIRRQEDEQRAKPGAAGTSREEEILAESVIERFFSSLTASTSCDLDALSGDLSKDVVLLHEGVVTRGRAKALQRLRSIRELQVALGVSQVAVESLELQKLEGGRFIALLCGHMRISAAGPLGSALCGETHHALFSHAFELCRKPCGSFCISQSMFRHV